MRLLHTFLYMAETAGWTGFLFIRPFVYWCLCYNQKE